MILLLPCHARFVLTPANPIAHLRAADPTLRQIIDSVDPARMVDSGDGRPDDHYGSLVRAIVGQQLSTKAARTIYWRLCDRFGGRTPTPREIIAEDHEQLRAVGLSNAKAEYLRSLAEHVVSGRIELERLDELTDEQIIDELVAVKGLGVWTAQMFLMFQLRRPDVLPIGDLGIRRAVQFHYELAELPPRALLEQIAEPWRPHRTLACRYLWKSLDNEPT